MKYLLIFTLFFIASCSKPAHEVKKTTINSAYEQAFEFRESGKADSAYLYFSKAKDRFLVDRDSLGAGKCLLNMAMISTDYGDLFGGQELSLSAIQFFKPEQPAHHIYIQSNLNNLGMSSYALKDYDRAIAFYKEAAQYTTDTAVQLVLQNNTANAYRRKGDLNKALNIYKQVLKQQITEAEYARTLSNFSYTKWLQNKSSDANPDLELGLKIRVKLADLQAQIASFEFLTEVNASSRPDLAMKYATRMYAAATSIKNGNDRLVALEKLIDLSKAEEAKPYFRQYHALNDSIQTVRTAAKNQFALIRYEAEKNKTENLKLQKENVERRYQVARRDLLLILATLAFISSAIIGLLWFRRRRDKMDAERQHALHESQLRTSKRVHDVVANGIYRVMTEIDHDESLDKNAILDKLELMYEKSRDISYDIPQAMPLDKAFHSKMDELLYSFATPSLKVSISGNTDTFWANISAQTRYELEHILQEFMINMKKHSQASMVSINFYRVDTISQIDYQDNGVGMATSRPKNGLENTGSRIKMLDGKITFDSSADGGLTIRLSFPTI